MNIINQIPSGLLVVLRSVQQRVVSLGDSSTPLLSFIPKPVKIILLLILILNSPSWPFLWHLRVWRTPLNAYRLVYTKGGKKYLDDWHAQNQRNGGVGGITTKLKRSAWFDDCDYNMHLSNSSYAKSLDASRMDWCIKVMSPLFTSGAHAALGAAHYVYLKEVPVGSEYVMETRCGGWGDKWMYLVTEFVIYPKNRSGKSNRGTKPSSTPAGPSISMPTTIEAIESSTSVTTSASVSGSTTPSTTIEQVKKVSSHRARGPREDGGVVCCLAVSEYCFKMGRVTIPPRICLYLSMQSPSKTDQAHARSIVESSDAGRAFLAGGWKENDKASQLGMDIGLDSLFGLKSTGSGGEGEKGAWITQGRDAMEKVVEGMNNI